MTAMVLGWRALTKVVDTQWRGPQGMQAAIARSPVGQVAGWLVPASIFPADAGEGLDIVGTEIRFAIGELPLAP